MLRPRLCRGLLARYFLRNFVTKSWKLNHEGERQLAVEHLLQCRAFLAQEKVLSIGHDMTCWQRFERDFGMAFSQRSQALLQLQR